MKTDLEIQKNVMEELKWDSYIKASDIGVAVTNGIVTLTGYVDNFSKKKAAENAALRVAGVKAVAEEIKVKLGDSFQKTDTEIAQAVLNALKWHSSIPDDKIKVKVENGWVTLDGEVNWLYEKDAVKHAVENLLGVKGVSNLITISSKVNTSDVKSKILAAFHRSASIDSDNIFVENIGNKVVLKGTVRSYAEKQDAEHAAWNATGVSIVENKLEVNVPVFVD